MVEKIEIVVPAKQICDEKLPKSSCFERLFVCFFFFWNITSIGKAEETKEEKDLKREPFPAFSGKFLPWPPYALTHYLPFSIHFLLCLCHKKKPRNSPKISDISHPLAGKFSFVLNSLSNFELSLIHYDLTQKLADETPKLYITKTKYLNK